jgi:predicted permease
LKVTVEGYTAPSEKEMYVDRMLVGPGFFDVMGIPVLSGRALGTRDDENAPKVCVVSAGMARTFFAETNPIGRRFRFERTGAEYTVEIVGVVKDLNKADSKEKVWRAVYCPMLQDLPSAQATLLVRVAGDPTAALAQARRRFQLIDKNLFLNIKTMDRLVDDSLLLQRFFVLLCSSFGLIALLLASAGLYGVMAYSVARRTNEIGIRMALGADRKTVVGMVLRETMKLVVVGIAVGLAAAWAATRLLATALFGVQPTDPLTMTSCVLVMTLVALVAGYAPSARAAGVDPVVALRHE